MRQKHISAAEPTPVRICVVTLDQHLSGAAERVRAQLAGEIPGLVLSMHAASDWEARPESLEACKKDIARGDIVFANMLFIEDHIRAIIGDLEARRPHCDAMIGCMSAPEIVRLTRMGRFDMAKPERGVVALLKRLRGGGNKAKGGAAASGQKQMAMLKLLPKLLRLIPGAAQDVRSYFLTMQYWLAASDDNFANLIRMLATTYAADERKPARGAVKIAPPVVYPEIGVYHPRMKGRISDDARALPKLRGARARVGLSIMRAYALAGDTAHYDAVIEAFERRGIEVLPVFASGLDARPAIEKYFWRDGAPAIDAIVSLTGFSLVGGPAYNDAAAAEETLAALDAPYVAAHAVEFQNLDDWRGSESGLSPIEATMMVALPELDGATGPIVFGGRGADRAMTPEPERIETLAARIDKAITLRKTPIAERKLAIVLFGFPPNGGAVGTAAYLSVYQSLQRLLERLAAEGYDVAPPENARALEEAILRGAEVDRLGLDASLLARIDAEDIVRRDGRLAEIEAKWGPAPGKQSSDGRSVLIGGASFGKVVVAVQPGFGYEGDPMRLLFEKGSPPTHAFCAFYRYLREDFGADALLHFGMHGALEFMPGKQTGMGAGCWPDNLIGDVPNFYLYAANNPSEATIAKRRSAATVITHLTPPLTQAGLYKGLVDLKSSIERWRKADPRATTERAELALLIREQALELDLIEESLETLEDERIAALGHQLIELECQLVPHGLHVLGEPMSAPQRAELMDALRQGGVENEEELERLDRVLSENRELDALVHALDGRYVRPVAGGDLARNPEIAPTGRNIHAFDPYRLPSAYALRDGAKQAELLLDRHVSEAGAPPETIALVLWGADNLKNEGGPLAQALALLGATARFDAYGRMCGAELLPLETLGRPRIDVLITLSGIFRDLLPLQTKLLAEAAHLAASADEPDELNFVAKHARAYAAEHDCDLEHASLRVFSNADGVYGSNVNQLVDAGCWDDEDELAEAYTRRKCFAYGRDGKPSRQPELMQSVLGDVELAYQNLESVELGVTTIDHYFDTLGGISRAAKRAKGDDIPVYIADQTRGRGKVRTLSEQVALETRTRMLNPKWSEGLLEHGYEGVKYIEAAITNTLGWSATTGQVNPWVYDQVTKTYMFDDEMREKMIALNPKASARFVNRLLEANERDYWRPDGDTLDKLREFGADIEDRLEGVASYA